MWGTSPTGTINTKEGFPSLPQGLWRHSNKIKHVGPLSLASSEPQKHIIDTGRNLKVLLFLPFFVFYLSLRYFTGNKTLHSLFFFSNYQL